MANDSIILELFQRIQKVEEFMHTINPVLQTQSEQIQLLKEQIAALQEQLEDDDGSAEEPPTSIISGEAIELCYQYGKTTFAENESISKLAEKAAVEVNIKRTTAQMYIYAVRALFKGTVYKRGISLNAAEQYIGKIYEERGTEGLQSALLSIHAHIEYGWGFGRKAAGLEALYEKWKAVYENNLESDNKILLDCSGKSTSVKAFVLASDIKALGKTPITVLAGSVISNDITTSLSKVYANMRKEFNANGILNGNLFVKDYKFASPSAAASVVLGRQANGYIEFTSSDKKETLEGIKKAVLREML